MRLNGFSLLIICATTGCATLTPEAAKMIVADGPANVKHCRLMGNVTASSFGGSPEMNLVGNSNSKVEFYNKAATLGGNTILFTKNNANIFGSSREGLVYFCDREARKKRREAGSPLRIGESKDTDAKEESKKDSPGLETDSNISKMRET